MAGGGNEALYALIANYALLKAGEAAKLFLDKYRLLVVAKAGLASGPVLRITPALFNSSAELDWLVAAIRAEQSLFT
ncbi:hypothetical protein [Sphingobium sp.]|uniref:hypothetical protein n=1 Tax=Sphingobium sp. TaxID=1912891 RepID=UPI0039C93506